MPRIAMTDRFVAGAKPQLAGGRTAYFDTVTKGLELLAAAKSKTWYFHFEGSNGKRARVKLGTYPATSLAVARGLAVEARGHVEAGTDARHAFASQDAFAMTVAGLVRSYLDKHVRPNLRTAKAVVRRMNKNVVPIIGAVKLANLHKRNINQVIDPVLERNSPMEAARCFEDMRAMFRWAVARGDLDSSPLAGMNKPAYSTPRERVLSETEIETLWNGLPKSLAKSPQCQRIIKLCLATAQRVGEIAGMRRDELDLRARRWSLPGSRTKNGHPHVVPLSDLAIGIISEAIADAGGSVFVFPNEAGSSLPSHAVAVTIGRAQEADEDRPQGRFGIQHWTAHDLRRTALTGLAKLGVAPVVIGHCANHRTTTKAGVTLGVYVQHHYEAEVRDAINLWAARLNAVIAGDAAKVVALRMSAS